MGKSKKAPGYATASYGTGGLFGESTTGKKGTTFTGTEAMNTAGNNAWGGLNTALQGMNSNDYSQDPNFQVYQDNFNRGMQQAYDTNVLGNLTDRGLMRSSGLQAATNSFNNTIQDNLSKLYDSYYNRQTNNLANNQNVLNNLFSYITGVNTGSQNNANNVSNYNLNATSLNNAATAQNNALYSNIAQTAAGLAMMSDINVKENIKKIGKRNGFNWYEFNYKKGLGLPEGKQEGVIAQEVEKVKPEAVVEINGIKHVYYSKI